MERLFKKGDWVLCIEGSGILKKFQIYNVKSYYFADDLKRYFVGLDYEDQTVSGWNPSRFIKATKNTLRFYGKIYGQNK
jgi:hypothetical protein